MRGKSAGSENNLTKECFLENVVGKCPEVETQIGTVPLKCILVTGNNVSTLTEQFFRNQFQGGDEDMHCTTKWLELTAANKVLLPYIGYAELDVQVKEITIPEGGFLIIKGNNDPEEMDFSPPGIIGMNIAE